MKGPRAGFARRERGQPRGREKGRSGRSGVWRVHPSPALLLSSRSATAAGCASSARQCPTPGVTGTAGEYVSCGVFSIARRLSALRGAARDRIPVRNKCHISPAERVRWWDWPCGQNPGRKPAISRRAMARETKELRRTGFDMQGQHFVVLEPQVGRSPEECGREYRRVSGTCSILQFAAAMIRVLAGCFSSSPFLADVSARLLIPRWQVRSLPGP